MAQGVLPFESEKKTTGMTALAGLPVYTEINHGVVRILLSVYE